MEREESWLSRSELLLGSDGVGRLQSSRVAVFGVGGVGSWCAEALVRSGVGRLTIVDSDVVSLSNVNRQLMATRSAVGLPKVDVLARRLLDINPSLELEVRREVFSPASAEGFGLGSYDAIVDAIDSLTDKAELMVRACETDAFFVSSMGAALKVDPTQVGVAEFWETKGCPLARALRKKFKRERRQPSRKFLCVFSPEVGENAEVSAEVETPVEYGSTRKVKTNGSVVYVTGVFGFTLASLVVNHLSGVGR